MHQGASPCGVFILQCAGSGFRLSSRRVDSYGYMFQSKAVSVLVAMDTLHRPKHD
jgi:hypothetical protein